MGENRQLKDFCLYGFCNVLKISGLTKWFERFFFAGNLEVQFIIRNFNVEYVV